MQDSEISMFFGGVSLAITCCMLFMLFNDSRAYPSEHFAAEKLCIKNSGYKQINYDITGYTITCNDGAVFSATYATMKGK